jgi:hypothetical protein
MDRQESSRDDIPQAWNLDWAWGKEAQFRSDVVPPPGWPEHGIRKHHKNFLGYIFWHEIIFGPKIVQWTVTFFFFRTVQKSGVKRLNEPIH